MEKWALIRVTPPLRLRSSVVGVFSDGWAGSFNSYTRYSTEGDRAGRVRVVVSRKSWGGPDKAGHVTLRIGPITIGDDKQPHVVRATETRRFAIHSKQEKIIVLDAPGPRFRIETTILPTFVPMQLSPQTETDARELGAKVTYEFLPPRKAAHK